MTWLLVAVAGAGVGVGVTFGVFGGGGSAFATPLLMLLGVPVPIAIASPLPAMLPASVAGAHQYLKVGLLDRRVAKLAVIAGVPAVLAGAALSRFVGGLSLVVLSGVMLLAVGVRMAWPTTSPVSSIDSSGVDSSGVDSSGVDSSAVHSCVVAAEPEAARVALVVTLVAGAGFLTGLLANGGGLLLVPIFVLVIGLSAAQAAGTSMVAVAALTVPTLIAHVALGHVDWSVAAAFAVGVIPASIVGARIGHRLPDVLARRAFGMVMVTFSLGFLALRAF